MKRVLLALVAVVALSSCGNQVDVQDKGNGTCEHVTEHQFFGVTYATERAHINCG